MQRGTLYRGLASSIPSGAVEHVLARYPNGRKRQSAYFVGHEHVGYRSYHLDGSPEMEKAYRDGDRHGYGFAWYEPGCLTSAEPFHAGIAHGIALQWSHEDQLVGRYTMIAGTGVDLWWHARHEQPGHYLAESVELRGGRCHGFQRWFDQDANVHLERHYWYGLEHGIEREWNAKNLLSRGYPRFFIAGRNVKRAAYVKAARQDATLPPYRAEEDGPLRPGAIARALKLESRNHQRWRHGPKALPPLAPLFGGLLIGGASSRMGTPKHLIDTGDGTIAERTLNRLRPYCDRVYLLGAGKAAAAIRRLPRIGDRRGVGGPLAGLSAAVRARPRAAWLIAACDLPCLSLEAIAWLVAERRRGRLAVMPRLENGELQPLLAIYEPECGEFLTWLASQPGRGPREVAHLPAVATPTVPAWLAPAWTNVNTPAELGTAGLRLDGGGS